MQLELFDNLPGEDEIGSEYYVYHKTINKMGVYGFVTDHNSQIIIDKKLSDEEVRKLSELVYNFLKEK